MSDAVFRLIEILMWGGWGYMLCKVFRINNEINVVEYSKKGVKNKHLPISQ